MSSAKTCMCVVKRTGRVCGNRARYSNFAGDMVCGNHTRSRPHKRKRNSVLQQDRCCICQAVVDLKSEHDDAVAVRARCCGNVFHTYCLDAWIKSGHPSSHTCPLCRRVMSPDIKHRLDFAIRNESGRCYTQNMIRSVRRNLLFEEFIYV